MSFVIAVPEYVTAAASDLANIGSTISAANTAAAAPTSAIVAAGGDEVSRSKPDPAVYLLAADRACKTTGSPDHTTRRNP